MKWHIWQIKLQKKEDVYGLKVKKVVRVVVVRAVVIGVVP